MNDSKFHVTEFTLTGTDAILLLIFLFLGGGIVGWLLRAWWVG